MKNYFAKLRENEEKGFSLVELIIVMAIMAILVGVVASQVIPYMEKSRQSKDQQQLSGLATDITSAIASSGQTVQGVGTYTNATTGTGVELDQIFTGGSSEIGSDANATQKIEDEFCSLRDVNGSGSAPSVADVYDGVREKLKSKAANISGSAGSITTKNSAQAKKISNAKIYVIYDVNKSKSIVFMSSDGTLGNAISKLVVESE